MPVSLEGVCGQTDQSESEAVVREPPRWRIGRLRSPHGCKSMLSNAELVVRQSSASKDMKTEANEAALLEAFTV
jgi:hypothetical protein